RTWRLIFFAQSSEFVLEPSELRGLFFVRHQHPIFATANDRFFDIGEKGAHGIEIAAGDWIKLVIVTLRTSDRLPQPNCADSADAVGEHPRFIILGLGSALLSRKQKAIKGGGDLLFERAVRKQISR